MPRSVLRPRRATALPDVVPHGVLAGYYRIQFDNEEYPTFVSAFEGPCRSVDIEPFPWIHDDLEWPPLILFGPLLKPAECRPTPPPKPPSRGTQDERHHKPSPPRPAQACLGPALVTPGAGPARPR